MAMPTTDPVDIPFELPFDEYVDDGDLVVPVCSSNEFLPEGMEGVFLSEGGDRGLGVEPDNGDRIGVVEEGGDGGEVDEGGFEEGGRCGESDDDGCGEEAGSVG
ncbi:hypothetical protein Adt_33766 [Abeliophyllum distichum]|uniref:Uncharacterized protein n=1 Tax=Abeliophyllum distichum TaxID=126358 RepID=A0ABD1QX76_9LAMI